MTEITKEKVIACLAAVAIAGTVVASEVARSRSYGSTTPTCNPLKACSHFEPKKQTLIQKGLNAIKNSPQMTGVYESAAVLATGHAVKVAANYVLPTGLASMTSTVSDYAKALAVGYGIDSVTSQVLPPSIRYVAGTLGTSIAHSYFSGNNDSTAQQLKQIQEQQQQILQTLQQNK